MCVVIKGGGEERVFLGKKDMMVKLKVCFYIMIFENV